MDYEFAGPRDRRGDQSVTFRLRSGGLSVPDTWITASRVIAYRRATGRPRKALPLSMRQKHEAPKISLILRACLVAGPAMTDIKDAQLRGRFDPAGPPSTLRQAGRVQPVPGSRTSATLAMGTLLRPSAVSST